MYILYKTLTF